MNHKENIADVLKRLGVVKLVPLPRAGAYVGFVKIPLSDNTALVFISGQVPMKDGKLVCGKVGVELDEAAGQEAAALCAVAVLAQLEKACDGDWNKVRRCVKLGGFVNCADDFTNHPQIINGASEVMVEVFGETHGKHARFAVGANSLPRGVAVEVEAQFIVDDA